MVYVLQNMHLLMPISSYHFLVKSIGIIIIINDEMIDLLHKQIFIISNLSDGFKDVLKPL